jgi:photosystem II stability/assembly factor-like uncharacterized protein
MVASVVSVLFVPYAAAADLRNFDDAALHAVQFVDENEGWAVGDEGVLWHTVDGGQNWERQPTGIRASLRSVHFLNPYTGWIAGREELPNGAGSAGVLLFTSDGGLKWRRLGSNAFPGLNRVRFVDHTTGFAVGDGTEAFPTGVFRTIDSGKTWKPVSGTRCPTWFAADFQDADNGVLGGAWGRLAVVRQGSVSGTAQAPSATTCRDLKITGGRAIAVDEGGSIRINRDAGNARWSYADLRLPTEIRASLSFRSVSCFHRHVWVAGRPGSVLLHSQDLGESWELLSTGQPLPLNGIFFASAQSGWAVGEFGSILHTSDGGKNWRVQRRGGQRAAVLFVHGRQTSLPLDTVAILGGDDGFLSTAIRAFACDPDSTGAGHATDSERLSFAMRQVGGTTAESLWQFPLPEHVAHAGKSDLVRYWNNLHADRARDELVRQLVLAIRLWRPSVIITDNPDRNTSGYPCDSLLAESVTDAFKRAEDPRAFAEQIERLGVEPWKVCKLYCVSNTSAGANVLLPLTDIKARLEGSARDFALPATAMISDAPPSVPESRHFRLLASRILGAAAHKDLMQGVELTPGGVARRTSQALQALEPETEKALRARRNLQALVEAPPSPLNEPDKILSQIGPVMKSLPNGQGAAATFALANQYVRIGQWTAARELFLVLVDRYPTHPLAADAYRWLIRHNSSSEIRRRHELGQFWMVSQSTIRLAGGVDSREQTKIGSGVSSEAMLLENSHSRQVTYLSQQEETRQWYKGCVEMGDRLAAFGPLFAADPSTQFCIQSARRQLGEFDQTRQWYTHFVASHAPGPWRDAAAAELWLGNRSSSPPKPVAYCKYAATRPMLDGDFGDACWQGVKPLTFTDAAGNTVKEYTTEVRCAYDKEFLYLAVQCKHPADRYVAPVKDRSRDTDVRPYDRIALLLDLDRDYSTYFHLQVDQRGCISTDCWGDRNWKPHWYVAHKSDPDGWRIEAAIPMIELTGDPMTLGRTWAFNVARILPGRGVQAWSAPADVEPRPEGMGLLMFLEDSNKKN